MIKYSLKFLLAAFIICVVTAHTVSAQHVKVIKFKELEKLRKAPGDTLYIVNFWATWCKPCIKEMPYFEAANKQYKDQRVRVVFVSMDAAEDLEKRVKPFVKKRQLQARLLLLDEPDGNTWIDKIEPKWSGAIPATLFFNNSRKQYHFVERELSEQELKKLINTYKP